MSPYVRPNRFTTHDYDPDSYFYNHANDSSSSDGSPVFSPQSTPLSVSSFNSGSRSSSSSSPPSTPPQRTLSPQRRVGFTPSPVTGELRPPTSEEIVALHCFESHAVACTVCLTPSQIQQKNHVLCAEGRVLAEEISKLFYRRDGIIYSTNSNPYKLVRIEFPSDTRRSLKLLKAIESDTYKKQKRQKQCRHRRSSPYQEYQQSQSPNFNAGDEVCTSNTSSPNQIPIGLRSPFNVEERRPPFRTHTPRFNADSENRHPQLISQQEYQYGQQPYRHSRHEHHYLPSYQAHDPQSEFSPRTKLYSNKRASLIPSSEREYGKPSKHRQSFYAKNGCFVVDWPGQSEADNAAEYYDVTGPRIPGSRNSIRGAHDNVIDDCDVRTKCSSKHDSQDYSRSNYSHYRRSLYDDDLASSSRAQRRYKFELREPREPRELREPSRTGRKSRYYVQRRPISSFFF